MRKLILIVALFAFTGAALTSCASSRGKGCPTTNPKYFRG